MASLVDSRVYPWARAEARELHIALCEIYPTPRAAMFIAASSGLPQAMLNPDQPAYLLWKDILEMAAVQNSTRTMVELVRDQNPRNARRALFEALLTSQPVPTDGQPRSADGSALFLRDSDIVSEPEALLFHDDLTISIGRLAWLRDVLEQLGRLAPAVCRLETAAAGKGQFGTGFRIARDLVLTNWHVLRFDGTPADTIRAEFGYEDDAAGNGLPTKLVTCDAATVVGSAADDWAVARVQQPLDDTIPIVKLSAAANAAVSAPAFVIQHPGGQRKRVAYVRNTITACDDRVVHYLSDTQAGSSGAPVFDDQGRILALHRAGGIPQEVAGRPPVKKNEGVAISRVAAGLAAAGVQVP